MDVYVINLDRQTERLHWMEQELRAAGVAFQRVRAVDAERLSPAFVTRIAKGDTGKLAPHQIAAIMSHRKVWRALLRSPAPHCMVFEDDVHIGRGSNQFLAALDVSAVEFDIVKLESVGERVLIDFGNAHSVAGRRLCPLRSAYMGAAGYVINRKAAATLLRVTRTLAVPIDWFLFADAYLASNGLIVLQTIPGIVAQEEHLRRLATAAHMLSGQPARMKLVPLERKVAREMVRPFRQLAASLARRWLMRAEPGLRWGRIDFE